MSQLFSGQDNSKNINQYQSNSYKTTIYTKDKITKIFFAIIYIKTLTLRARYLDNLKYTKYFYLII